MIKLTYINHINEIIEFNSNGLFMTETELHNYKWLYNSENNKISNLSRGIAEKKMKVVIATQNREDAVNIANRLMECTEKDVIASSYGKLYFGEYYIPCYITASSKDNNYNEKKGFLEIELTIITDAPAWIKEINKSFTISGSSSGKNLDFAFDFPYDFASSSNVKNLINTSFADSDFKMIIYGEANNPVINIGNHAYGITGYIANGQHLVIDSKSKTITLVKQDGEQVNFFKNRNKESYIFQKVASGENGVTWSGNYTFDIILYEERSEPKWT